MKTNATVDAFSSDHWMNGNLDSLSWVINPPTISENSKDVLLSEAVENGFAIPTSLVPFLGEIKSKLRYQVEFYVHRKVANSQIIIGVRPTNSNLYTALVTVYDDGCRPHRPMYEIFSPRIVRQKRIDTHSYGQVTCGFRSKDISKASKMVASFAPVGDAEMALVSIGSIQTEAEALLAKPRKVMEEMARELFVNKIYNSQKEELLLALERADAQKTPIVLDDCRYLMETFEEYKEARDKHAEKVGYIGDQAILYVVQTFNSSDVLLISHDNNVGAKCTRYPNADALPHEVLRPLRTMDVESTKEAHKVSMQPIKLEGIGYFDNSEQRTFTWSYNPYQITLYAVFVDHKTHSEVAQEGRTFVAIV